MSDVEEELVLVVQRRRDKRPVDSGQWPVASGCMEDGRGGRRRKHVGMSGGQDVGVANEKAANHNKGQTSVRW